MSTVTLSHPAAVEARLSEIENDLAEIQNELEDAALDWFRIKRKRERAHAERFIGADGSVADRNAVADRDTADAAYAATTGLMTAWEAEGRYEALKAKARVLDTRAAIGMSILRAQSRVGA